MKTLAITLMTFQPDMTAFSVEHRIISDDPSYRKSCEPKFYEKWDTTLSIDKTKELIQADLEKEYGI